MKAANDLIESKESTATVLLEDLPKECVIGVITELRPTRLYCVGLNAVFCITSVGVTKVRNVKAHDSKGVATEALKLKDTNV